MATRIEEIDKRVADINVLLQEDIGTVERASLMFESIALRTERAELTDKKKKKRIKAEERRLTEIYKDADTNTNAHIEGLIKRAAFMRIELEDYEEDIRVNGSTELFTQSISTPPYTRERPVVRLYNSMQKNYQTITKQLSDALPESQRGGDSEEFDEFCRGGRK